MEETEETFFISNSDSETFQVSLNLSASGALEHFIKFLILRNPLDLTNVPNAIIQPIDHIILRCTFLDFIQEKNLSNVINVITHQLYHVILENTV